MRATQPTMPSIPMPVPERLEIAPRSTDPTGKDDRALMPIPNKPAALVGLRQSYGFTDPQRGLDRVPQEVDRKVDEAPGVDQADWDLPRSVERLSRRMLVGGWPRRVRHRAAGGGQHQRKAEHGRI